MRRSFNATETKKRFQPLRLMGRMFHRAWGSYIAFHTLASYKMQMAAYLGICGFPVFYALWTWISPQAYESPLLRGAGFLISLVLGFSDYWSSQFKRYLPIYSYLAFLFALPIFFVYMLLMNEANVIWQLSTIAAFVYVALLYDSVNMVIVSVSGTLLGWLGYLFMTGGAPLPPGAADMIPIVGFALFGLVALNYSDSRIADEKMQAASRLASHIAHEMRTPLLGITFDADKANKHIPELTDAHRWALENGYEGRRVSNRQTKALHASMERIRGHTQSANMVIDMLLVNAGQENFTSDTFNTYSAAEVVEDALSRYHFRPGERDRVRLETEDDFVFFGSDLLLVHTIFNLLKNSLRAVEAVGGGETLIRLERGREINSIIVSDDGPGILPEVLPQIFVPFYTGEKQGQGTGIGLAFSRYVVESFDGTIECQSVQGHGATFTISLPRVPDDASHHALQFKLDMQRQ